MLSWKRVPFRSPQKSSTHEKAAAQQVFAQLHGLGVGELPVAHLHRIQPGPVVDVVAIVEIDGLLDGACLDARETADGLREMAVGARIILCPPSAAFAPVAATIASESKPRPRAEDGYIRRAKAHSDFSRQSAGRGKLLYSMPGYSRNGI